MKNKIKNSVSGFETYVITRNFFLIAICAFGICISSCVQKRVVYKKPVIYLYPQQQQQVSVKIDLNGIFTVTDPFYKNGWNVIAAPDGKFFDPADGKNYPYLFWEAELAAD